MKICIGTHVNGCAGIASVQVNSDHYHNHSSAECYTLSCDYNNVHWTASYDGKDFLLLPFGLWLLQNKLSAFPSTITSSEVIWLIRSKLRESRYMWTTEGYNCMLKLRLMEGWKGTHPVTNNGTSWKSVLWKMQEAFASVQISPRKLLQLSFYLVYKMLTEALA